MADIYLLLSQNCLDKFKLENDIKYKNILLTQSENFRFKALSSAIKSNNYELSRLKFTVTQIYLQTQKKLICLSSYNYNIKKIIAEIIL